MAFVTEAAWTDFSSFANDTSGGGRDWLFVTNAATNNNSNAQCTATDNPNQASDYLRGTNVVNNIPHGQLIVGIQVRYECYRLQYTAEPPHDLRDNSIRLFVNNVATGDNKAVFANWPNGNPGAYLVRGGASDLWSISSLPLSRDFVATDFGFGIQTYWTNASAPQASLVDHMQMKFYHEPNAIMMVM